MLPPHLQQALEALASPSSAAAPTTHADEYPALTGRRADQTSVAFCLRSDPGGTGQGHNTTYVTDPMAFDNRDAITDSVAMTLRADCHGANPMIAATLTTTMGKGALDNAVSYNLITAYQESQSGVRVSDTHPTLDAHNGSRRHHGVIAATLNSGGNSGGFRAEPGEHLVPAVTSKWAKGAGGPAGDECQHLAPPSHHGVRRLTPLECERLQAFPDGWTCLCEAQGATARCVCPDSPRYKQMGNAVTVSVIRWIATRLRSVATAAGTQEAAS